MLDIIKCCLIRMDIVDIVGYCCVIFIKELWPQLPILSHFFVYQRLLNWQLLRGIFNWGAADIFSPRSVTIYYKHLLSYKSCLYNFDEGIIFVFSQLNSSVLLYQIHIMSVHQIIFMELLKLCVELNWLNWAEPH